MLRINPLNRIFTWFENKAHPFPEHTSTAPPQSALKFCWHYSYGMRGMLALMTLLTASLAMFEISLYGYLGNIVDWLATKDRETFFQEEWPQLLKLAMVVLLVLPLLVFFHSTAVHQGLMGNFPMAIRWLSHRHLLKQSLDFYQNEFAGRIATKVMQTALATREATTKVLDVFVYISVSVTSMLVLVAHFHLLLMIPFVVWLIVYTCIQIHFIPKLKTISTEQADARADMTGRVVDSYTNIHTVKLFAHTDSEARYAKRSMRAFLDTVYHQMRLVTGISVTVQIANYLLLFSITALGLTLWQSESISIGAMAVAVSIALRLNGMSQWIMWEIGALFENIGTLTDGANTLSKPISIKDRAEAKPLTVSKAEIHFDHIHFNYGGSSDLFNQLTLSIKPGEKVGLVGRSGAGKSTIVNLLLRLYDIESGAIRIDDQNIADVKQESLRAQIGMVTQDTSLLHRSIRENILYGNPDATDEEMIAAAKKAQAHEFISELVDTKGNKAYDAQVGERGVKLSGGQRQRIAIARVLLKNAPILILDEATSALDSEVEAAIQANLHQLIEGKTVIAIAHRLSTIAALDRLIVLEQGQIIEQGTHNSLIEQNGLYAQLWSLQSGGFIADQIPNDTSE